MIGYQGGYWGAYGGRYVPDTLYAALDQLCAVFESAKRDAAFLAELDRYLKSYIGRPTALFRADRISAETGLSVYLKREDLNHTGAHKINNAVGQVLLAKRMGKRRVIAETGAGQHGVATATACALLGLECVVYMGEKDIVRQALNVYRMELLGATVQPVSSGSKTLKDATSEAIRDWLKSVETTHYVIGSVVGPDPFPQIVRYFQSVIGREAREQILALEGRLPHSVVACVGGGSNAMGIFSGFLADPAVGLIAIEAGGLGDGYGQHAASLRFGRPGILHGAMSYLLQSATGQIEEAHSISAGLDYPGVGPELSALKDAGRLTCWTVKDDEAVAACKWTARLEGIIPALESSHALAALRVHRRGFTDGEVVMVNVSGRGDKDMETLRQYDPRA